MKYYVVADIHGFYDLMIAALTERGYFADTGPHKLIICGDLFDRGSQCMQLQDFVYGLLRRDEVILIRGNHEDLLEDYVDNLPYYVEYDWRADHHRINGTVQTVLNFTGSTDTDLVVRPQAVAAAMKHTAVFKNILPAMRDYFETKNYIFVHGWIPSTMLKLGKSERYLFNPDWRCAGPQEWESARWYNGMTAARQGDFEPFKMIICGHVHTSYGHFHYENKGPEYGEGADFSPYYAEGVIAIDGAAADSGRVNCIVIEDD